MTHSTYTNSRLASLVDFDTLTINVEYLSKKQKQYAHLIDPRFFKNHHNPFREGKSRISDDYHYETPIDLDEELFYLQSLMDPAVLEQGAVRRFPSGVNEKYISEKYFEDKWVSEGNNTLANHLEHYLTQYIEDFQQKERIRILDIGPCGGAITTLFALRALSRKNLLNKVELVLLDIVPNVLEATLLGRFHIPSDMISEYHLDHAGLAGSLYKQRLSHGILMGVEEWYRDPKNEKSPYTDEALLLSDTNRRSINSKGIHTYYYRGDGEQLPKDLQNSCDIVISAYTHHHMNLYGRKILCEQMELASNPGGFIGIADFYVPSYEDYMQWYKPHFEEHGDAPPVECPIVSGEQLASWLQHTAVQNIDHSLEKTFVFSGIKYKN